MNTYIFAFDIYVYLTLLYTNIKTSIYRNSKITKTKCVEKILAISGLYKNI